MSLAGERDPSRSARGYALGVSSRRRLVTPIALLVVLAVLFAPNREEQRANSVRLASDPVEALILAPTVGEGMRGAAPKLWSPRAQITDHSPPGTILPSLPSAALVLLVSLMWLGRPGSREAPRGLALSPSAPRGPPDLQTA
jgi:hypothetical protein